MTAPFAVIRAGLAATLVAVVLSGCGSEASPESAASSPAPTATPSPSATAQASPSPDTRATVFPDLIAESEIPWMDVGPGWFVLGYDPESGPEGEWDLASGDLWLLSRTGEVYQGPPPPPEAMSLELFRNGSEVWFTLPSAEPLDEECSVFRCADVVPVDLRTGAVRDPIDSPYWPRSLTSVANGSVVMMTDCCDFSLTELIAWDGTTLPFQLVVTVDYPLLTPDGKALVWKVYEDDSATTTVVRTFLNGGEEEFTVPEGGGSIEGWIDGSTVALYFVDVDEDPTFANEHWLTLDLDTGQTTPWVPPADSVEWPQSIAPGFWLWWPADESGAVVTNNDGSFRVSLECATDYCEPMVADDRLLWIEWDASDRDSSAYELGGRQRLTLVDLRTGRQTVIFDVTDDYGRIVDYQRHATLRD